MKTTIHLFIIVLCAFIANHALANSCLPSQVKVLDENGNDVHINPKVLEQYSPYKGYLTFDSQTGYANFVPDALQAPSQPQAPCYDFPTVSTVTPTDKTYTIAPNQKLKIKALLDNNFEPRDEFTISGIVAEPVHGRANIKARNIIKYTPHQDWCGVDYLTYELQSEDDNIIEQVKINVSCTIDTDIEPAVPVNTPSYQAKVFDVNGDGLQDVYITQKVDGRHQDFYLKQKAGAKFDLVTSITTTQSWQATSAPETDILVIRADYNADGMLDFLISNIDAYIWGADEQIILAKKKDSAKLDKIIAIDAKFRAIRNFIENMLRQQSTTPVFVGLYNNTYAACRIVYLPYVVYSSYYERWITYYIPVRLCMSGRSFLQRYLRYDENFNFIASLATINSNYGLNNFNSPTGVWHANALTKILPNINDAQLINTAKTARSGVQIWRAGSVTATVVLIADDVTGVGVLNDVGLIVTVSSIALAFIAEEALDYYIATMEANPNSDDVGVTPGDASLRAGPFAIPDNCDPRTPGQTPSKPEGDPRVLRRNIELSNCGCIEPATIAAAHHIIPRKSGGAIGSKLRQCLKNRDIGIDSAVNGVCLPKEPNNKTNAFPHFGSEGNLHGIARLQELLTLCESNSYSNREFEDLLRTIADGYTKGIMLP